MGKKHSLINYCYKTDCNNCRQGWYTCLSRIHNYGPLYAKIRNLKQNGRVDHMSIEEFRSKLRYQPKGDSADELALKGSSNLPTASKY